VTVEYVIYVTKFVNLLIILLRYYPTQNPGVY